MHVLLVEDDDADAELLDVQLSGLKPPPASVVRAARLSDAIERLSDGGVDLILLDLSLPDSQGMHTLSAVLDASGDAAVVVLTGLDDDELGADAVHRGAQDYLVKGQVDGPTPARAVRYAAERQRMISGLEQLVAERTAEVRERDRELRRTRQLEAVGRLAAGVAHDFNNDLAVVCCAAEMLEATLTAEDPRRSELTAIIQAATRGASLTRRLLAFGGKPANSPADPEGVSDFNDVVAAMRPLLVPLLGSDITLRIDLSADTPVGAISREELERSVLNLCTNARDAMPSGGKLSLTTRISEPGAEQRFAIIAVADTGIGMDSETVSRAFEPFFTTKGAEGTGLGLSGVFGSVRAVGGEVRLASRPGEGTEVVIFVPISTGTARPASAGPAATADVSALRGDETILLVDDDPLLRQTVRRRLLMQGYTVLEAQDGEAAQRLWRPFPGRFDVLVTDVIMPKVVGPELAMALREDASQLPVVFMSAHLSQEGGNAPDADAQTALLGKPFTASELLHAVRRVLGGPGEAPPEDEWVDPMIGRVLADRYAVYGVLGRGGMGTVYLARQAAMDRLVALKVLDPAVARSPHADRWLRNEARAASQLSDNNTITVYDFGETDDGLLFLAMELLDGQPLDEVIADGGTLPPGRACRIAARICDSLAEAHAAGIIHRDIKPGNVFVGLGSDPDSVRVMDFGIAALGAAPTLEKDAPPTGVSVGTPDYMAPEHAAGRTLDGRADLYAVGVLLYRCLSGALPFGHIPRDMVLRTKVQTPAPPLGPRCPQDSPPPRELVKLVMSLLRIDPDDRPESARALAARLRGISGVESPGARR